MSHEKNAINSFAEKYQKEVKEILILTNDGGGGASRSQGEIFWTASKNFLAYFDLSTGELKKGTGRVCWSISEEELKEHDVDWPHQFKDGVIYRLKVRALNNATIFDGMLSSHFNQFMVVEVLEENVQNDALLAILTEYRAPIKISDQTLGEFVLNKDLEIFEGSINWLNKNIPVSLEVESDSKRTWTDAMDILRILFEKQKQKDLEFRSFAAQQLTDLANDWLEDENEAEITQQDFIDRISLSDLEVTFEGNFTAYFDDDDMFWGHVITVYGNIQKGLNSANIEG